MLTSQFCANDVRKTHNYLMNLMDFIFQRPISRTKSASISTPLISMDSYEKETSLKVKEHVAALNAAHGTGNLVQQTVVVIGNKVEKCKKEIFSPLNHWNNTHDRENEHLGKSGLLGMCDDPYCTTCPTYFKASKQRSPKALNEFDSKVSFFLKIFPISL